MGADPLTFSGLAGAVQERRYEGPPLVVLDRVDQDAAMHWGHQHGAAYSSGAFALVSAISIAAPNTLSLVVLRGLLGL
ncbi:hypothetical protein, partial [Streptomyces mirabilis]